MNIWKALSVIQTLGTLLTVVGELSKRLGEALLGPNLGPSEGLTDADDKSRVTGSLASTGAEDEKPETQGEFEYFDPEHRPR